MINDVISEECVCVCRRGPTIGAVLILGAIDGAVRLHLQLEALAAGQPGHNPLQLGF